MTENEERMIRVACEMYKTAAVLHHENLTTDASSISAKARALVNKALEDVVTKE